MKLDTFWSEKRTEKIKDLTTYFVQSHIDLYCLQIVVSLITHNCPKQQILDSSKLKAFADNNFAFHVNEVKFSKLVENTEGKGEITHYEQFLLFPQCFQKTCTADM